MFRAPGGVVVHLYLPGYVQGKKDRRPPDQGMCAAAITRAVWLEPVPSSRPQEPLRWCAKCLGLALAKFGLIDQAVEAITPYFRTASQAPTQERREEMGSPDGVADPQHLSGGRQQPSELVSVAPITEERGGVGSAPAPPASPRPRQGSTVWCGNGWAHDRHIWVPDGGRYPIVCNGIAITTQDR